MQTVVSLANRYLKVVLVLLGLAILGLAYGGYLYYQLDHKLTETETQLAATAADLATAQQNISVLQNNLNEANQINSDLHNNLQAEKDRNDNFANQIGQISSTVSDLAKLKGLDPELLKKYSKVYFLNENYAPKKLTSLPSNYTVNPDGTYILNADVWSKLKSLMDNAQAGGINLKVASAYRDFGVQSSLKSQYRTTYGSGANQFSADQGYSEHQLGTTVDLSTTELKGALDGFDKSEAYQWLVNNAYRYGFILSYPKGNDYYVFEPWHWRYVGTQLATDLHNDGANFYDWDQRKIDEYLIKIFD